ncbi:MAG: hypothetical protein AB9860_01015 [Methanomassiliicoccales archaeon]
MGMRAVLPAIVLVTMLLACCFTIPGASGDEAVGEMVPEPQLLEWHIFNEEKYGVFVNEEWALDINNGGTLIKLAARNMTQLQGYATDYQFNIHYDINGTTYIAQLYMMDMGIIIDGQEMQVSLATSNDLELNYTPTVYVGNTPTLWCNISFNNISAYSEQHPESTFDLTLSHHIVADWNETRIKVEAMLDLSDLLLFSGQGNDIECEDGTQFAMEIRYRLMVGKANSNEGALTPARYSNTTLEYDLTTSTGAPLTISSMNMENDFTISNASSSYPSTAYSSLNVNGGPVAIHGFPGLIYKDTVSLKSDPEITVFHDRESDEEGTDGSMPLIIGAALIAAVIVLVVFVTKKKGWL